ncbi:MAG: NAD(P)-binding domain-containing protein, partial [Spirochaetia bacterium]|nr:NAD(P)-binding domain-containing protein [Spirochaetia bacterium]
MKLAILGTGMVGQTLAIRMLEKNHDVTIGTRDVAATRARKGKDGTGFSEWQEKHPKVKLATFTDAAANADLVFNATNGKTTLEALSATGKGALAGKILIDISNPLDFSKGMPPTLFVSNDDSLAEHIQKAFPETKVVKSLNTLNAGLMLDPANLAGGDHSIFVSGNDAEAKAKVVEFLKSFGWKD